MPVTNQQSALVYQLRVTNSDIHSQDQQDELIPLGAEVFVTDRSLVQRSSTKYVCLSVSQCNSNPLDLQSVGTRDQNKGWEEGKINSADLKSIGNPQAKNRERDLPLTRNETSEHLTKKFGHKYYGRPSFRSSGTHTTVQWETWRTVIPLPLGSLDHWMMNHH